jgi:hypothetical protein
VSNLHRKSPFANPCPDEECSVCSDARAHALAAHLGLADEPDAGRYDVSTVDLSAFADPATDPAIEADARAAESVSWGGWEPILKRPVDEDEPDELVEAWEPAPDEEDRAWAAQFSEEGAALDDLSPWEEALEILGERSWERACREHAEMMEEMELEHTYHLLIETLGGLPQEW